MHTDMDAAPSTPSIVRQRAGLLTELRKSARDHARLVALAKRLDALTARLAAVQARRTARVQTLASSAAGAPGSAAAWKRFVLADQSDSAKLLAVQMQMQRESQAFALLSNVLKASHDTVKNAISNIR